MERLPDIVPVAPAITENELRFGWNHEEVKAYLQAVTEKYVGLVVTEENLPDMEKAKREITKFRTSITKFKGDGKRRLKIPADKFSRECDELLRVVEDVEAPIAVQLVKYEAARKNELRKEIIGEYQKKASVMGLDMSYWQLDISEKWLNRTQKWSDTCCAIDTLIKQQLEGQKAAEARAEALQIKQSYAKACVEMENQGRKLKTPLTWQEVYPGLEDGGFDVEGTSMEAIKAMAADAARERFEIEELARNAAVSAPRSDPEPEAITTANENAFKKACEEHLASTGEITHEEAAESSGGVLGGSANESKGERGTYLAITISFTANKYAEKDVKAYVQWLENDICNHGAFPVVTIEEVAK